MCSSLNPSLQHLGRRGAVRRQLLRDESGNIVQAFAKQAVSVAGVYARLPQRLDAWSPRIERARSPSTPSGLSDGSSDSNEWDDGSSRPSCSPAFWSRDPRAAPVPGVERHSKSRPCGAAPRPSPKWADGVGPRSRSVIGSATQFADSVRRMTILAVAAGERSILEATVGVPHAEADRLGLTELDPRLTRPASSTRYPRVPSAPRRVPTTRHRGSWAVGRQVEAGPVAVRRSGCLPSRCSVDTCVSSYVADVNGGVRLTVEIRIVARR